MKKDRKYFLDEAEKLINACMIGVKLARLAETMEHDDSWKDIIGYAALGGEIVNHEKETSI